MPTFRWTVAQSRLARRIAALFAICGLGPLLVLTVVTGWTVSDYLLRQEQLRLRALAKESSMAALGRLLDLEDRLHMVAARPADAAAPATLRGTVGLARLEDDGRLVTVFGRVDALTLEPGDRARLATGGSVLRLPIRQNGLVQLVVPDGSTEGSTLVAAIDPRALWGFDDRSGDASVVRDVCAASDDTIIACTDPRLERAGLARFADSGAGLFSTLRQDEHLQGAFWSAPLHADFGSGRLTTIIVTRTADAVAPASALVRTFALVVVAVACMLLLVGLWQIRRLVDPIARLQAGTSSLARGEFGTRVDVRTGDELQALGASFNAMAGDLQRQFEQLHALSVGTLEALARTIDAKSPWTAGHSMRVAEIALAIGQAMRFDPPSLERLRRGALLHDIGKIGVSADILDSPAALTPEQRAIVQEHPVLGARILEPLPHCADILPMVLQHHERFDGRGYPAGLAGEAIALDARVLALADAYDAMTSERPYRRGRPAREAAVHVAAASGTQFDPDVVDAFLAAFRSRRIPNADDEPMLPRSA
jgi:putative nucleotidyltransferase with HDIG domain